MNLNAAQPQAIPQFLPPPVAELQDWVKTF